MGINVALDEGKPQLDRTVINWPHFLFGRPWRNKSSFFIASSTMNLGVQIFPGFSIALILSQNFSQRRNET